MAEALKLAGSDNLVLHLGTSSERGRVQGVAGLTA